MDDQFSVQIPSVLSPWDGLEKIMNDFQGKVHQIMESADLNKLDLNGQANLIIVSLSPVQGSSNERKAFQDNGMYIYGIVLYKELIFTVKSFILTFVTLGE